MVYKLYFASFNIITLHFSTMRISGRKTYITGYDDNNERIDFIMDRFQHPDDEPYDYGYCHIISYVKNGVSTPCNIYGALA